MVATKVYVVYELDDVDGGMLGISGAYESEQDAIDFCYSKNKELEYSWFEYEEADIIRRKHKD